MRAACAAAAALAAALALAVRWPLRLPVPLDQDAVDFALALERFDLVTLRPHPPGYPVFVGAARALLPAVGDPLAALASLSALASAACALPVAWLAWRLGGPPAGAVASLLWAVQPLGVVTGVAPLSDGPGLFLALSVAAAASLPPPGQAAWVSGLVWGVAAGVRLSAWPVAAAAAWALGREGGPAALLRFGWGTLAGALPWLAWLSAQEGGARLLGLVARFARGHFADWGGTPWAGVAGWAGRLGAWARVGVGEGLLGAGAAGALPRWLAPAALAVLLALGAGRGPSPARPPGAPRGDARRPARLLAAWALLSAAWALLGQNPASPRHLLPLAALLCVVAGVAARRAWDGPQGRGLPPGWHAARRLVAAVAAMALAAAWAVQALAVAAHARAEPPPAVALARDLDRFGPPARTVVLAAEEARVLSYLRPAWTVIPARSPGYVRRAVRALPPGTDVLLTSSVVDRWPPAERQRAELSLLAEYAGPALVYGDGATLRLYRLRRLP